MQRYDFAWAVFTAWLGPLVLAGAGQPLWVTALHIAICLSLVALADAAERRAR